MILDSIKKRVLNFMTGQGSYLPSNVIKDLKKDKNLETLMQEVYEGSVPTFVVDCTLRTSTYYATDASYNRLIKYVKDNLDTNGLIKEKAPNIILNFTNPVKVIAYTYDKTSDTFDLITNNGSSFARLTLDDDKKFTKNSTSITWTDYIPSALA